jgi:hypothetical protein
MSLEYDPRAVDPETIKTEWVDDDGNKYKYEGQIKRNGSEWVEEGYGKLERKLADGLIVTYEGEFVDGYAEGKGTQISSNGYARHYVGDWVASNKHGKGTMTYDNGTKYVGEFVANDREGKGTLVYANGDTYVGLWKNNTPSRGIFKTRLSTYRGDWANSTAEGVGITNYATGGNMHEGHYKAGKFNGPGKMTNTNETGETVLLYEGNYKDDLKSGFGIANFPGKGVYEGAWVKGKMQGTGTFRYSNGDVYEGEFKDGLYEGLGTSIYANRAPGLYDRYFGEWHKGHEHGVGIMTGEGPETKESGFWKNGKCITRKRLTDSEVLEHVTKLKAHALAQARKKEQAEIDAQRRHEMEQRAEEVKQALKELKTRDAKPTVPVPTVAPPATEKTEPEAAKPWDTYSPYKRDKRAEPRKPPENEWVTQMISDTLDIDTNFHEMVRSGRMPYILRMVDEATQMVSICEDSATARKHSKCKKWEKLRIETHLKSIRKKLDAK